MRAVLLLALVLLAGCHAGAPRPPATYTPAQPDAAAAPWLDPQAQIASAVRLITPNGVDLRQAAYLRQGAVIRIVALTRDYTKRAEGVSDPQSLQLLPTGPGEPQPLDPGADYLPIKLFAAPSRASFCLSAVKRGEGVKLADAALNVLLYGKDNAFKVLDQQPKAVPLGYVAEQLLLCRNVMQRERAGGLVILGLDWTGSAEVCDLAHGAFRPTNGISFAGCADGSHIAGYQLRYDPALPAQAQIEYSCTGKRGQTARWSLPYHVSYETELWQPPLEFIDNTTLATLAFRPDTSGRGDKANYDGLFRLVALDAQSGALRIIEDRVMPYTTLVAGAGLVFYVLRLRTETGVSWEVWAASADGLAKQRVWSTTDAEYVTLEDLLDGRRLLVHRQYVLIAEAGPELRSELVELSLGTLEQSTGVVQPEPAKTAAPADAKGGSAAPAEGQDLFIPDKPGGGEDSGDGGGGAPGPAPGGEGGSPPPIAVP
jgi:hypothetical protein